MKRAILLAGLASVFFSDYHSRRAQDLAPSVTLRGQIEEEEEKQKGEAPCIIRHTTIKEIEIERERERLMKERKI